MNKDLFKIAIKNSKIKECPGCGKIKPIEEFNRSKNCNNCPKTELCRTMYYNGFQIMKKEEAILILKERGIDI